ncbi:MAG: cytochrome [Verrucomicrobiales bacterium]|nr:cytochrome [Verrucomicrobiales bacterium]
MTMRSAFDDLLNDPDFIQHPYPVYRRLRESSPVYWSESWGCWILTRYEDIVGVLQDPSTFSSQGRVTNVIERGYSVDFQTLVKPLLDHFKHGLINSDPPDHTRMRRLVQKSFLPRALEILRPQIERMTDALIQRGMKQAHFDVVKDLAYPLPVSVIAELLGVPPEMHDQFKEWTSAALVFQAVPKASQDTILRSQSAIMAMRSYLENMVRDRRIQKKSDLISELVEVEEVGEKLSQQELLSTGVSLLVAGHETTTSLITSTIRCLAQHPEALREVQEEDSLLMGAIEESLRFESPLQRVGRTVTRDIEVGDQTLKKGQSVLSFLGAANRDPAQFASPDRFDIHRSPNKHMAFGSGNHFCLGAALARMEAPIVVKKLLLALPRFEVISSGKWQGGVMRGLESLTLRV